jgi:hypothetical protein
MNGQVVVVTGASAGIGRACARAFAARGDSVALLARGGTGLAAAAADVERRGGHAVAIETDVADYEQVSSAAGALKGPGSRPGTAEVTGLAAVPVGGMLGGEISYRQAGGANHTEDGPGPPARGWLGPARSRPGPFRMVDPGCSGW